MMNNNNNNNNNEATSSSPILSHNEENLSDISIDKGYCIINAIVAGGVTFGVNYGAASLLTKGDSIGYFKKSSSPDGYHDGMIISDILLTLWFTGFLCVVISYLFISLDVKKGKIAAFQPHFSLLARLFGANRSKAWIRGIISGTVWTFVLGGPFLIALGDRCSKHHECQMRMKTYYIVKSSFAAAVAFFGYPFVLKGALNQLFNDYARYGVVDDTMMDE